MAADLDSLKSLLIDRIFAQACGIADSLSNETWYGPEAFGRIDPQWHTLEDALNEVGEHLSQLPPSVSEHVIAIGKIVVTAAVGPGYADVCKALRESPIREHSTAGWQAYIRETKPPAVHWVTEVESAAGEEHAKAGGAADDGAPSAGGEGKAPNTFNPDNRETKLKSLQPAERKAYFSFVYAEQKVNKKLEDREAYDWLNENGLPDDAGNLGELEGYELPDSFETWRRYLSEARRELDESKYSRRAKRPTGRSIAKADQV